MPGLSLAQRADWHDWIEAPLASLAVCDSPSPPLQAVAALAEAWDSADPWRCSAWLSPAFGALAAATREPSTQRTLGQVFTPRPIAEQMVGLLDEHLVPALEGPLRVLDPAAGAGIFLEVLIADRLRPLPPHLRLAAYADLCQEHLFAVELDPLLAALLQARARAGWMLGKLEQFAQTRSEPPSPPEGFALHIASEDFLQPGAEQQRWPPMDAVVGNPPYAFGETMPPEERARLAERYEVAEGQFDRAWCFIEEGLGRLKPGGLLQYVVPDALIGRLESGRVREWLAAWTRVMQLEHVGPVFPGVGVSSAIFTWRKERGPSTTSSPRRHESICHLGELVTIRRGEELGRKDLVALQEDSELTPILRGEDVVPFATPVARYGINVPLRKSEEIYAGPKLLVVKTGYETVAAVETAGLAALQSVYLLHTRPQCSLTLGTLAWLLNSPTVRQYVRVELTGSKKLFPQLIQQQLAQLPLPPAEVLEALQGLLRSRIPALVETGLTPLGADPYESALALAIAQAWKSAGIR